MNPFKKPKMTQVVSPPPPPVPTFDDAYQREEFSRKVRRRRGHAANQYAPQATPSVASRVLLG